MSSPDAWIDKFQHATGVRPRLTVITEDEIRQLWNSPDISLKKDGWTFTVETVEVNERYEKGGDLHVEHMYAAQHREALIDQAVRRAMAALNARILHGNVAIFVPPDDVGKPIFIDRVREEFSLLCRGEQ